jgi:hypothetical protein
LNQQKQLPSVYFRICIKPQSLDGHQVDRFTGLNNKNTVIVEGGRLIQSLPVSFAEAIYPLSWLQQAEFHRAFEADVINLLVGSLAEAKYIASCDNEAFNANLVNLNTLHNYGGSTDIELVNEYMECYMPDKAEREPKLAELFLAAYNFVNDSSNWRKITALAKFIRDQPGITTCNEVISLLGSLNESMTCQ